MCVSQETFLKRLPNLELHEEDELGLLLLFLIKFPPDLPLPYTYKSPEYTQSLHLEWELTNDCTRCIHLHIDLNQFKGELIWEDDIEEFDTIIELDFNDNSGIETLSNKVKELFPPSEIEIDIPR